jgi:hypothetical protein
MYLFEVHLAQCATFKTGEGANLATVVTQALHNLGRSARETVEALPGASAQSPGVSPARDGARDSCRKCGRKMIERPGKRRHEYVCICEDGQVDELSQNLIDRAKRGERPRRW